MTTPKFNGRPSNGGEGKNVGCGGDWMLREEMVTGERLPVRISPFRRPEAAVNSLDISALETIDDVSDSLLEELCDRDEREAFSQMEACTRCSSSISAAPWKRYSSLIEFREFRRDLYVTDEVLLTALSMPALSSMYTREFRLDAIVSIKER